MVGTRLHWVGGPWRGKLAMAARPRGGDWLADEMADWKAGGVQTVLSLLEPEEELELQLDQEAGEVRAQGMKFRSFPIRDRDVPNSERAFGKLLVEVEHDLSQGQNVVLHCRQGIGRTGLVAVGLFVLSGDDPLVAMDRLSAARGIAVPETAGQRTWMMHFAEGLAAAK